MSEFCNAAAIAARLGLKAPWKLLDCAEKIDETHFRGFKAFTVNEQFFVGHFPVHPIVPGVLHVEAVRQLCLTFAPGKASDWRVAAVEKVKFRRQILPGDRVTVEAEKVECEEGLLKFKASCSSASGRCTDVMITFCPAEENADFVIPETIENLPVKIIGSEAFAKNTAITSVTLPKCTASVLHACAGYDPRCRARKD